MKKVREIQLLYDIIFVWNLIQKTSKYNKKEADTEVESKRGVTTEGEREGGGASRGRELKSTNS